MELGYALSELRKNFASPNWWRTRVFTPYVLGTLTHLNPQNPGYDESIHVMKKDWDNLIILDACRADYFEEAADLDEFDDYRREVSLGSHSSEWTKRNFEGKEFGDTVYVTGNPHTSMIAGDSFHEIIEPPETEVSGVHAVLPESMMEAARDASEQYPNKRLIIHFMQPHGPFIHKNARNPPLPTNEYWDEYKQAVEYIIPRARGFANELDGLTAISADHGQMMGSKLFGLFKVSNHPPRLRYPGLVSVPWATVGGKRRDIREGDTTKASVSDDLEDRLAHLGYR
jgi:hypothetical protein